MTPIKVVVHGALGRVGQVLVNSLYRETGLQVVGAVDAKAARNTISLPEDAGSIPLAGDLEKLLSGLEADVVVDFTVASATLPAARAAAKRGVNLVIGTTGFSADAQQEIEELVKKHDIGAVICSNFALGAVLMIHLAKIAAKYMDYAEIIELHHNQKADAPSGTAINTARIMASARGGPFQRSPQQDNVYESRGQQVEKVNIHSVRLPGLMAHQEVIFGGPGQTLSIRHDTINRECYIPGVVIAVKEVVKHKGIIYGLDNLLGLV
jgi:4-hydroxy-tetrahydrodipicolinate reductase